MIRSFFTLCVALTALVVGLPAQGHVHGHDHGDAPARKAPYSAELVHAFSSIPLLDEGRIKPFGTYAQFLMLRVNEHRGKRLPVARLGVVI